jgi:hypothetical protein
MAYQIKQNESDLYATVRAAFVLKNTSLAQWCKDNAVLLETARQTLAGLRRGDEAEELRQRIMRDAGVVAVE